MTGILLGVINSSVKPLHSKSADCRMNRKRYGYSNIISSPNYYLHCLGMKASKYPVLEFFYSTFVTKIRYTQRQAGSQQLDFGYKRENSKAQSTAYL